MALTPSSLLSSLFLLAFAGAGIENASLKSIRILGGSLHHVQGIDLDRDHFWVTSVAAAGPQGYLDPFNRATAKFERRLDVTDGDRKSVV